MSFLHSFRYILLCLSYLSLSICFPFFLFLRFFYCIPADSSFCCTDFSKTYDDPWRVMSKSSRIAVSTKGTNMIVYHRVCACTCARVCGIVCMYVSRHLSFRSNFLRSCVLDLRGEDCCCWSRESMWGMIRPVVRPRLILIGRYCHRCWNRTRHRQMCTAVLRRASRI